MRKVSVLLALVCGLAIARASFAGDLTLTLDGPGPTGTVVLSGTALPSGYQSGVNCYAGLLEWNQVVSTPPTPAPIYTYCIDVASIITSGKTYYFEQENLATATQYNTTTPLFPATVVDAIENLWIDQPILGNTSNGSTISASGAAEFQVALWDIINNWNGVTGSGAGIKSPSTVLNFSSPSDGFTQTELNDAISTTSPLGWAEIAYSQGVPKSGPLLQALVATDGSQNQAIYIGPDPAPVPRSFFSGLVLFGMIATATKSRRMRKLATQFTALSGAAA
jgi:hypothetical protein